MVNLFDVNEQNWQDIASLNVSEYQKRFLDRPIGIIARGYIYRQCNAKVMGISYNENIIGVALVKDMDEEPACYDLQQFMIDRKYQNKGYGSKALRLILLKLSYEGKYNQVEVCVHKENDAALKMYNKIGFVDTGYIDERVPYCRNLMYSFHSVPTLTISQNLCTKKSDELKYLYSISNTKESAVKCETFYSDILMNDFSDPLFQNSFKKYFAELAINIRDWDGLFKEMNDEGNNAAFVRTLKNKEIIGFILFKPIKFTSHFFEETAGFIREFWIDEKFRKNKHGTTLLRHTEKYFMEKGMYTSILTTDSAADFYKKQGYIRASGCKAKNNDDVYVKRLW